MKDRCPVCDALSFEVIKDSVDIGVGEQEFIIGGECSNCGQINFCRFCGAWQGKNGLVHYNYCIEKEEANETNSETSSN